MSFDVLREVSYGGLVVRGTELLAIVPRGKRALALPKGGADPDETGEQTAVREVREETGIDAAAREELGDVTYWYSRDGRRIFKTVRFYLCDYVAGEPAPQAAEVDEVRWIGLDEAPSQLSYRGEREMAERAARRLAETPSNG